MFYKLKVSHNKNPKNKQVLCKIVDVKCDEAFLEEVCEVLTKNEVRDCSYTVCEEKPSFLEIENIQEIIEKSQSCVNISNSLLYKASKELNELKKIVI
jgi:hypothetical protein